MASSPSSSSTMLRATPRPPPSAQLHRAVSAASVAGSTADAEDDDLTAPRLPDYDKLKLKELLEECAERGLVAPAGIKSHALRALLRRDDETYGSLRPDLPLPLPLPPPEHLPPMTRAEAQASAVGLVWGTPRAPADSFGATVDRPLAAAASSSLRPRPQTAGERTSRKLRSHLDATVALAAQTAELVHPPWIEQARAERQRQIEREKTAESVPKAWTRGARAEDEAANAPSQSELNHLPVPINPTRLRIMMGQRLDIVIRNPDKRLPGDTGESHHPRGHLGHHHGDHHGNQERRASAASATPLYTVTSTAPAPSSLPLQRYDVEDAAAAATVGLRSAAAAAAVAAAAARGVGDFSSSAVEDGGTVSVGTRLASFGASFTAIAAAQRKAARRAGLMARPGPVATAKDEVPPSSMQRPASARPASAGSRPPSAGAQPVGATGRLGRPGSTLSSGEGGSAGAYLKNAPRYVRYVGDLRRQVREVGTEVRHAQEELAHYIDGLLEPSWRPAHLAAATADAPPVLHDF